MTNKPQVVAATPTYNMADSLNNLLPRVLDQNYDRVLVLDDASSDDGHTRAIADQFSPDVEFVWGAENVGAGANRNRILGRLGETALVHFMDADTMPISNDNPDRLRACFEYRDIGGIGGLVVDAASKQVWPNYGPLVSVPAYATGAVQAAIYNLSKRDYATAVRLREKYSQLLEGWPNTFEPPVARDVFWMIEANMAVPYDVFEHVGGFDPRLRFHEIQDLAIKLERLGLRRRFEPTVVSEQHEVRVRSHRGLDELIAVAKIVGKYGVRQFVTGTVQPDRTRRVTFRPDQSRSR